MNEMELYFARENLKWNLGIYVLIGILVFCVLIFIGSFIAEYFERKKIYRKEKKK